jgi:N-methylhydantoinase A
VRIANQEMVRALRVVTVERGVDPRGFILIPFGGAGPMHAAAVAEELEVDRIICPQAGGVLSALGLISSERRRDRSRTLLLRGPELTAERLAQEIDHLRAEAGEGLEGAQPEVSFEMRYRGQAFELSVSGSTQPDPLELSERFAQAHESRYGYRDPGAEVELVNIRLAMVIAGADPVLAASTGPSPRRSARQARFAGAWLETAVLRGELPAGTRETGPAILELPEATVVIPPGWVASVDAIGSIRMERS